MKNDKCRKQLLHSWRFGNQVPSQSSSSWDQASHYKQCLSWWPRHSSSPLACSCYLTLLSRSHQASEGEANPISVCRRCRRHHMVSDQQQVQPHWCIDLWYETEKEEHHHPSRRDAMATCTSCYSCQTLFAGGLKWRGCRQNVGSGRFPATFQSPVIANDCVLLQESHTPL